LSYEWGLPGDNDPIIHVDNYRTRVRRNLFDALLQIRLEDTDRHIWIDALSIEQAIVEERNHQVQLMGCIYRDAKNIVVWLGPAKDDSDLAMSVLADVGAYLGLPEDSSETQHTSIVALCTRPYWRRVWVQQELHLARQFTVYCGSNAYLYSTTFADSLYKIVKQVNQRLDHRVSNESHRVSKERLGRIRPPVGSEYAAHRSGNVDNSLMASPAYSILAKKDIREDNANMLGIWLAVCIYRDLMTSEPRDLIYAMLGVSSNCQKGELIPDYNKPLQRVYIETISICEIQEAGTIDRWFLQALAVKLGLAFDEKLQMELICSCGPTVQSELEGPQDPLADQDSRPGLYLVEWETTTC
jgi:hypothetical protein